MELIAQTGPRGKLVAANMTSLAAALDDSGTEIEIAHDIFSDGEDLTLGEEDITVGTHGTTLSDCLRGVNDTAPAAHANGRQVRRSAGAELLSHTFAQGETLKGIRLGGEVEALFGIEVAGTLLYTGATTPYSLELLFPMPNYQPGGGVTIRALVWLRRDCAEEAVFWSMFMGS
ncbi:MAG: hypothetical protein A2Z86_01480 [Candidatus Glassbacteria bacterium GWA2_58_10]|uniref:Uncharacterized protein n=1 Tax=Candidatus Glassbacteria bacterium GWA2_58_10 TaxID=1817865 RepID=A0A1F5YE41_9BACT|nr:MAG: hypothetical protein A2Z86_01480 [Candidatus Glassbacteria bacterium GWA2_58_10]